jgi:hypothetical protein
MPAKRNTNKLSQLYKTIDQKGLSQDAKETLKKLRLATANFNKKEGKEADAFNLFYNRLLAKKPTAIKTTKEYKEMVLEKKREVARKMMEAKKAKQESRQGQGSERDASRPAKPFGWRLKGKHNYRKPTRADISTGKAYYEARINRADTKRTKFPMLERGGYMAEGGQLRSYKTFVEEYPDKKIYVRVRFAGADKDVQNYTANEANKERAISFAKRLAEKNNGTYEGFKIYTYANGGYMANGGEMDKGDKYMFKKGDEVIYLVNSTTGKYIDFYPKIINDINYNEKFPIIKLDNYWEFQWDGKGFYSDELGVYLEKPSYAKGDYMAHGGSTKFAWQNAQVGDSVLVIAENKMGTIVTTYGRRIHVRFPDGSEKTYFAEDLEFISNDEFAKGGAIKNQYEGRTPEDVWNNLSKEQRQHFLYDHAEEIENYRGEEYGELTSKEIIKAYNSDWRDLDKNIKNRFNNHTREGQYADGGKMENRRTLKFSDAVLYKGNMYTFVKRDGDVGFVSNSQGAWGMSGSFLPLRNLLRSDLEENLTDMYGNKFYIPPYDELIKMPYGFAKGGSMDNGGIFYTESHKLGHE